MAPVNVATVRPAPDSDAVDAASAVAALGQVEESVARVIRGKRSAIRLALTTLLARGHLLIEDVPGVGKTTLARALARSLGGTFRRIQFTSDLLPSDIVGVSVYNQDDHRFEFRQGPIFANVVLADEINRTTPRTQSSLLEAMAEHQVSVDNTTHDIEQPFLVVATQNPQEHYGTYPLPESQMDRFLLRVSLGYPGPGDERQVITSRGGADPVSALVPVISRDTVLTLQDMVDSVKVDSKLLDYVMAVLHETRNTPAVELGVSPRGGIAWYRGAQAYALVHGRDYCVPDDFKDLAVPALAHRLVLGVEQESLGRLREACERQMVEILGRVPVPG